MVQLDYSLSHLWSGTTEEKVVEMYVSLVNGLGK